MIILIMIVIALCFAYSLIIADFVESLAGWGVEGWRDHVNVKLILIIKFWGVAKGKVRSGKWHAAHCTLHTCISASQCLASAPKARETTYRSV